ncbi:MAG: hypothetical protein HQK96_19690 [Nitrospirae bacterium]|nr:hypothetical protein [Nitrospirota bacterium]
MLNIVVTDKDGKEIYRAEYPEATENKRIEDVIYKAIGDAFASIKTITSPAPTKSITAHIHEYQKQMSGASDWWGDGLILFQVKSYSAPDQAAHHKER